MGEEFSAGSGSHGDARDTEAEQNNTTARINAAHRTGSWSDIPARAGEHCR